MSLLTPGGGTRHPNPDAATLPADEARRLLEELRLASIDVLAALDASGMLPADTVEVIARLRAATAAVPAQTILVPFGEPCPDGSVVILGGGR